MKVNAKLFSVLNINFMTKCISW